MSKAYLTADRYLGGFHVPPGEVAEAFRKISRSRHPAAPSYLTKLEQKMEQDGLDNTC